MFISLKVRGGSSEKKSTIFIAKNFQSSVKEMFVKCDDAHTLEILSLNHIEF